MIDFFGLLKIIEFSPRGGGIFIKLFLYLNLSEKLFITILAFLSILVLDYLFQKNRFTNYFILITLILSLPLFTLYQKYLDPLIFLIIFGLIKSNVLNEIIHSRKIEIKFYLMYFFSFYIFSLIYYLRTF